MRKLALIGLMGATFAIVSPAAEGFGTEGIPAPQQESTQVDNSSGNVVEREICRRHRRRRHHRRHHRRRHHRRWHRRW